MHPAFAREYPINMVLKPQDTEGNCDTDLEFPADGRTHSLNCESNSQVLMKIVDGGWRGFKRQHMQESVIEIDEEECHEFDDAKAEHDESKPVGDRQHAMADVPQHAASSLPEDASGTHASVWAPVSILAGAVKAQSTGPPSSQGTTKARMRVPLACVSCSRMKMRCDFLRPCSRCRRMDRKCVDRRAPEDLGTPDGERGVEGASEKDLVNEDGAHVSPPLLGIPSTGKFGFRPNAVWLNHKASKSANVNQAGGGARTQNATQKLVLNSGAAPDSELTPSESTVMELTPCVTSLPDHEMKLVQLLQHADDQDDALVAPQNLPLSNFNSTDMVEFGACDDDALAVPWGALGVGSSGLPAGVHLLHPQGPVDEIHLAGWDGMLGVQAQQHFEAASQLSSLQAQTLEASGVYVVGEKGSSYQTSATFPMCEHNKPRQRCKECKVPSICEHNKQRYRCRDCCGASICEHGRYRSDCKDCGGSSICEHNRQRRQCKSCGGTSICEHNRQRHRCRQCGGSSICEHNKHRYRCKECGGSSICEHNRHRYRCRDCGGSSICEHKKHRYRCKECKGSSICKHNKHRYRCKECRNLPNDPYSAPTAEGQQSGQEREESKESVKPEEREELARTVKAQRARAKAEREEREERVRAVLTAALEVLGWDTGREGRRQKEGRQKENDSDD
eukprot:2958655-Rhodomonas_salina.1